MQSLQCGEGRANTSHFIRALFFICLQLGGFVWVWCVLFVPFKGRVEEDRLEDDVRSLCVWTCPLPFASFSLNHACLVFYI